MSDKPIAEWELDLLCPSNGRDCDHANGVCKDYRPATAAPIFVPSEAFVVPLEDPNDFVPLEKVRAQHADFLKRATWARSNGEGDAARIWTSAAELLQYLLPWEPS
jgi:hypothetical protein